MKIKHLIPIISSVGIIPIAMTSCVKYDYVTWSKGRPFVPTVGKYHPKTGEINQIGEAGYVLYNEASRNPKIISEALVQTNYEKPEIEGINVQQLSCAVGSVNAILMGSRHYYFYLDMNLKYSGLITIELFEGKSYPITLNNAFISVKGMQVELEYDSTENHPFSFDSDLWREVPYINMPQFTLSNGRIVVGKNKTYIHSDMQLDPVQYDIGSKIINAMANFSIPYFDEVEIPD